MKNYIGMFVDNLKVNSHTFSSKDICCYSLNAAALLQIGLCVVSKVSLCMGSTHSFMKYLCLRADLLRLPLTMKHNGKEVKGKIESCTNNFWCFSKTIKLQC